MRTQPSVPVTRLSWSAEDASGIRMLLLRQLCHEEDPWPCCRPEKNGALVRCLLSANLMYSGSSAMPITTVSEPLGRESCETRCPDAHGQCLSLTMKEPGTESVEGK